MILFIKQIIYSILNFPNRIHNRIVIKYKNVTYDNYPVINGKIFLSGGGKTIFGKNVQLNSSLTSNPIGGDTRTLLVVFSGATLTIGDYSGLSNVAISCKEKVTIGKYVKIGGGVKIYDSDFHSLNFEERKNRETDISIKKAIELKDGCFIGAHSIILKGVTIGKESIVGAGSIVSKSIPDREIWAGNPIKFIKKI
jgi:acetyltransferase-like isoleucine patch superfamily enzyme